MLFEYRWVRSFRVFSLATVSAHKQVMRPLQVESFVSRVMGDVEALPSVALPSVEELRMQYPGIGCWAPTYAPSLEPVSTSMLQFLLRIYPFCNHIQQSCPLLL